MANTMAAIYHTRDNDGNYVATFPINTADEVYYDIDHNVKLADIIKRLVDYRYLDTLAEMYALTKDDVFVGSIINVKGTIYRVIDLNNLNNASGYTNISSSNKPISGTEINLIVYTSSDI